MSTKRIEIALPKEIWEILKDEGKELGNISVSRYILTILFAHTKAKRERLVAQLTLSPETLSPETREAMELRYRELAYVEAGDLYSKLNK